MEIVLMEYVKKVFDEINKMIFLQAKKPKKSSKINKRKMITITITNC